MIRIDKELQKICLTDYIWFCEWIYKIWYKYGHDDKKVKLVWLNTKIAIAFLNTQI